MRLKNLNILATKLAVSKEALNQKLDEGVPSVAPKRKKPIQTTTIDKPTAEYLKIQDKFLSLILNRSTLRELLEDFITVNMFITKPSKLLYKQLKEHADISLNQLKNVPDLTEYVKIELLLYEELYAGLELNELHDEASRLQADLVTKYVKTQKHKISEAQNSAESDEIIRELQEKDKHYNLLLNQVKGAARGKESN